MTPKEPRRGKRRVTVELYRKDAEGRVARVGQVVTEYSAGRRGGSIARPAAGASER